MLEKSSTVIEKYPRAREMVQQLIALGALSEDQNWVASICNGQHTTSCNFSFQKSNVLFWSLQYHTHGYTASHRHTDNANIILK